VLVSVGDQVTVDQVLARLIPDEESEESKDET
jgi:pyruvate/2-oxoglutarate dehydrogenase complex dihydrolipoamide acyltransferase (E2) component